MSDLISACLDCGMAISLCECALARITDPSLAFQARVIAELQAELAERTGERDEYLIYWQHAEANLKQAAVQIVQTEHERDRARADLAASRERLAMAGRLASFVRGLRERGEGRFEQVCQTMAIRSVLREFDDRWHALAARPSGPEQGAKG